MMVLGGRSEGRNGPALFGVSLRTVGEKWKWVQQHSTDDDTSAAFEPTEYHIIRSARPVQG